MTMVVCWAPKDLICDDSKIKYSGNVLAQSLGAMLDKVKDLFLKVIRYKLSKEEKPQIIVLLLQFSKHEMEFGSRSNLVMIWFKSEFECHIAQAFSSVNIT